MADTGGKVLFWRLDGQMDRQMDGCMYGWMDRRMEEVGVAGGVGVDGGL